MPTFPYCRATGVDVQPAGYTAPVDLSESQRKGLTRSSPADSGGLRTPNLVQPIKSTGGYHPPKGYRPTPWRPAGPCRTIGKAVPKPSCRGTITSNGGDPAAHAERQFQRWRSAEVECRRRPLTLGALARLRALRDEVLNGPHGSRAQHLLPGIEEKHGPQQGLMQS